jgi:hypothetical protein
MGRFSPDKQFSPRPIFALGLFVHNLGTWLMGYDWGTDLYVEGMRFGVESGKEQAAIEAFDAAYKETSE